MVSVYVASSFLNKAQVREVEAQLRTAGFEVTSSWVNHSLKAGCTVALAEDGIEDLRDQLRANVLLVLWPGRLGTASEIGVAIGAQIPVYIVSDGTPIDMPYAYLPQVKHVRSVTEFIKLFVWNYGG